MQLDCLKLPIIEITYVSNITNYIIFIINNILFIILLYFNKHLILSI